MAGRSAASLSAGTHAGRTVGCLDTLKGKGTLCATKQREKSPTNQEELEKPSHDTMQRTRATKHKADINDIN